MLSSRGELAGGPVLAANTPETPASARKGLRRVNPTGVSAACFVVSSRGGFFGCSLKPPESPSLPKGDAVFIERGAQRGMKNSDEYPRGLRSEGK